MAKKQTNGASAAVYLHPDSLTPWEQNPRNNDEAVGKVAKSIERFGFASPIIARKADGRVIAGHTRLRAALQLGLDEVPVRFMDLDDQSASALALADNRIGEVATWNDEELRQIMDSLVDAGTDVQGLGWDEDELRSIIDDLLPEQAYTAKVEAPIYEITGDCPDTAELFDQATTNKLLNDIEALDVDDDTRGFLVAAAHRHTVFQYDKIAEYYAHAPADIQTRMEDSALVIIDFDKAIELGFVKLTEELSAVYRSENE